MDVIERKLAITKETPKFLVNTSISPNISLQTKNWKNSGLLHSLGHSTDTKTIAGTVPSKMTLHRKSSKN